MSWEMFALESCDELGIGLGEGDQEFLNQFGLYG